MWPIWNWTNLEFFLTTQRFDSQMQEIHIVIKMIVGVTTTSKHNIFWNCLEHIEAMYCFFKSPYSPWHFTVYCKVAVSLLHEQEILRISQFEVARSWCPLPYSATLTAAERNYDIYNLELLAIVKALRNWRPFLARSPHKVKIFSDHMNLQYWRDSQKISQRVARV